MIEDAAGWPSDWDSVTRAQRRAWAATSADERLRWLEEALTFAQEAGALERDRARRAAEAAAWEGPNG
jgi:hypothetical protein